MTIENRGRVVAVSGGIAEVHAEARSCGSCKGCLSGRLGDAKPLESVFFYPAAELKPGDEVTLTLPESALATGALLAYLLPVLTLLVGALIGNTYGDALAGCGAAAGLAIGLGLTRWLSRRLRQGCFMPEVAGKPHPFNPS